MLERSNLSSTGDYTMSLFHGSLARSTGRFAVISAALAACLLAPSGFAQVSSSAQTHADFDAAVQDQYPNQGGYNRQGYSAHRSSSWTDHLAIEAGGGFNVPTGNTKTWQMSAIASTLAAVGCSVTDSVCLAEYTFNRDNIPQNTLTSVGEPNGNVHVWSLTLDPIIYYKTSGHIGGYVTGGGGFYRKLTSFTESVFEGDSAVTSMAAFRRTAT